MLAMRRWVLLSLTAAALSVWPSASASAGLEGVYPPNPPDGGGAPGEGGPVVPGAPGDGPGTADPDVAGTGTDGDGDDGSGLLAGVARAGAVCDATTPVIVFELSSGIDDPREEVTAEIVVTDVDGRIVERRVLVAPTAEPDQGLALNSDTGVVRGFFDGFFTYPGAAEDDSGATVDWPGWKLDENGEWVVDLSDAQLRQGVNVAIEIGSEERGVTATESFFVEYVPDTAICSGPPGTIAEAGATGLADRLRVAALLAGVGGIGLVAARRRTSTPEPQG